MSTQTHLPIKNNVYDNEKVVINAEYIPLQIHNIESTAKIVLFFYPFHVNCRLAWLWMLNYLKY